MKNLLFAIISLIAIALFSCNTEMKTPVDSQNVIVLAADADSLTLEAAQTSQDWWVRMSGKTLAINEEPDAKKQNILLGKEYASEEQKETISELSEDGFIIAPAEHGVFLGGKTSRGDIYSATTFLEQYLGCMLLAPGEYDAPKMNEITLPQVSLKSYNPDFDFRRTLFPGQHDREYRNWYKLEQLDDWGMFVHTFHKLLPPETYFEEHPEYYSEIGGRRLQDAQLCLSNPEVIDFLIENLGKEMALQPEKNIWSVSQNDAYNYCECERCKKLYEKYGAYSGAYIHMANEIARAYPNKVISTLAYQFTREAPQNIKPDPNVNIMFCSIECNRSMPLTEDPRSASFVKDMKDWSTLTNNIFLWDYVVQFKNYLTPFPNFHVLQPNLQFFKNSNVNMMFEQGSNGNWSDLSDLKQYLIANLMWNVDANADSLIDNFITRYYGPAAPHIRKYFTTTHANLAPHAEKEFLNIYGFPADYADSYLTPEMLIQYKSFMDDAEAAVASDSTYLKRVLKTRLPVDFAYLDVAMNTNDEQLSFFSEKDGKKSLKPEMMACLDRLEALSNNHQDIRINERNFKVEDYCIYARNKLEKQTIDNLLKDAIIEIKTPYSDRYPVGGAKAINDGLLGDLDFHNNWLGFHGEDMIVDITFPEKTTFSTIQMNFLKAVNSWVFLPIDVKVEVSDDGENFREIAAQQGDQSDRTYLVKSIPFVFDVGEVSTKHLRVMATSMKECPEWHRGYGNPSWIFVDEVIVE
ncbi:MAG: hypothetical protein C0593_14420 [Marinilabiliales bacterium]|nr:MAG: hypothetical protein C0593_14420 [Marinilabiliales bacterium]